MERVKADTGATCTMCRKSIRKGSWVTVHGGFWRHPKCAVPTADCEACGQSVPLREDGNLTEHFRYGDEQKGICDASPVPEEPKACGGCGEPAPSHDKWRSEEHTSELQSQSKLVCRLLIEKKKTAYIPMNALAIIVIAALVIRRRG